MLTLLLLACTDPIDRELDLASDAIRLPAANGVVPTPALPGSAPVLHVTGSAVVVDARAWQEALSTERAHVTPEAQPLADRKGQLIAPLYERLAALADAERAAIPGERTGDIVVRIDEGVRWEVVQSVLYTAGQATYGAPLLALSVPEGEQLVPLPLPGIGGWPLGPHLAVRASGVELDPVLSTPYAAVGEVPSPTALPCRQPGCAAEAGRSGLDAFIDAAALEQALSGLRWPPPGKPEPGIAGLLSVGSLSVGLGVESEAPWALVAALLPRLTQLSEAEGVPLTLTSPVTGGATLIRPDCSAVSAFKRRSHLDLARRDAEWLSVSDPLVHDIGGAVMGHTPSSTLTAWTPLMLGGYAGLYTCHGLWPAPGVGRAEGDRQIAVQVNATGEVIWEQALGMQGCCGHTWWSSVVFVEGPVLLFKGQREQAEGDRVVSERAQVVFDLAD